MTVAPVVVKPDTASNTESVNDRSGTSLRIERRRAGEPEEDPEHGDDQEAVAQAEVAARVARGQPQEERRPTR